MGMQMQWILLSQKALFELLEYGPVIFWQVDRPQKSFVEVCLIYIRREELTMRKGQHGNVIKCCFNGKASGNSVALYLKHKWGQSEKQERIL